MSFYSQTSDFLDSAVSSKDSVKIAVASRDAVRATIKFLFGKKNADFDENETLLGHIHSRIVEEFVSVPEKIAALDFVRMLGSNADHGIHVKRTQAAKAVMQKLIELKLGERLHREWGGTLERAGHQWTEAGV